MKSFAKVQLSGLILLISMLLISTLVSMFSPYTIDGQNLANTLQAPNMSHWLGTDQFGRDMLTRLASAILLSFSLGFLCVVTASLLGMLLGVTAAWCGGKVEQGLEIVVNILLALPGLVLVLLLAALAPGSFAILYIAISLVQWVEYYRVSRAVTKPLLASPEIQVSTLMGFGKWYIFRRHIWPALQPSMVTMAAFGGANAILTMASLGFIAVGIQPPVAELGLMTVELFAFYSGAPWALAQPLIAVALLILGFHLLAGRKDPHQALAVQEQQSLEAGV